MARLPEIGVGALVLRRRVNQSFTLRSSGDAEIEVTLIESREGSARLLIRAPGSVKVLRNELIARAIASAAKSPQSKEQAA